MKHTRPTQFGVVPNVLQKQIEIVVVGVAGAAEIVIFDAVQIQFQTWQTTQTAMLFAIQFGDILERDTCEMCCCQFL